MPLFDFLFGSLLKRVILFFLFSIFFHFGMSQDVGEVEAERIFVSDNTFSLFLTTSGGGIGYQYGWIPSFKARHAIDVAFLYTNHEKAIKGSNFSYEGARSFSYGKLYDVCFLRVGYSYNRITHKKPYWGGVDIGFFFTGGFSLGIGIPAYLEIAYLSPGGHTIISKIERYDPTIHDLSNIIGGAPFYERFHKLAIRPGGYGKAGIVFDFSSEDDRIRAFEIGVSMDMIIPTIQQMAFNDPKPFFIGGYIAYNFGSKKMLYE